MPWRGKITRHGGWESAGANLFSQTYPTAESYSYGETSQSFAHSPQRPQFSPLGLATPPKSRHDHYIDGDQPRYISLHLAAAMGSLELVSFALQRGEQLDSVVNGILPLHAAASGGDKATVRLLLQCGADVDGRRQRTKDNNEERKAGSGAEGSTALHFAAANGHSAVVTMLLEYGAAPAVVDHDGATPEILARAHQHSGIANLLHSRVHKSVIDSDEDSLSDVAEQSQKKTRAASCELKQSNSSPLQALRHKFSHDQLSATAGEVTSSIRDTSRQAMSKVASNPTLRAAFARTPSNDNVLGGAIGKSSPPVALTQVQSPLSQKHRLSIPMSGDRDGRLDLPGNVSFDSLTSSTGRTPSPGSKLQAIRKKSSRTLRSFRSLGMLGKKATSEVQLGAGGIKTSMDVIRSKGGASKVEDGPSNAEWSGGMTQLPHSDTVASIEDSFVGLRDQREGGRTSDSSLMLAELQETQAAVRTHGEFDAFPQDIIQDLPTPEFEAEPFTLTLTSHCDRSSEERFSPGWLRAKKDGLLNSSARLSLASADKALLSAHPSSTDDGYDAVSHTGATMSHSEDAMQERAGAGRRRDVSLFSGLSSLQGPRRSPSLTQADTDWSPFSVEMEANDIFGQAFKSAHAPLHETHLRPRSVRSEDSTSEVLLADESAPSAYTGDDSTSNKGRHRTASGHTSQLESPFAMLSADDSGEAFDAHTHSLRSGHTTAFEDIRPGLDASHASDQQRWAFADGILGGESGNDPFDNVRKKIDASQLRLHRAAASHGREFSSPSPSPTSPVTPSYSGNGRWREIAIGGDAGKAMAGLPRSRSLLDLLSRPRSSTLATRPSMANVPSEKTADNRQTAVKTKHKGLKSLFKSVKGAVGVS